MHTVWSGKTVVQRVEPGRAQIEAHFSCWADGPMLLVLAIALAVALASSSALTPGGLGTEVSMPISMLAKRFL